MPVFFLLSLAACTGPPPDPAVELGTGDIAFEPLSDGADIDVIQGPQGGFHVLGSVRAKGIEPGDRNDLGAPTNPTTTFRVLVEGQDLTLTGEYTQGLDEAARDDEPWTHQMVGRLCILDIDSDNELDGVELELELTLREAGGTEWTDSRVLYGRPYFANE